MTRLRLVVTSGALALALAGAGIAQAQRQPAQVRAAPLAAAKAPAAPAKPDAKADAKTDANATAKPSSPDLRDLPAGILARAARARALDRSAPCRTGARADDPGCTPQRDIVEIQWDVARER